MFCYSPAHLGCGAVHFFWAILDGSVIESVSGTQKCSVLDLDIRMLIWVELGVLCPSVSIVLKPKRANFDSFLDQCKA